MCSPTLSNCQPIGYLKGHSQLWDALTWTLLLLVWKEFTSTRNQMYASATSRNPLQSCLVFHSILDLLQKTSFWANFNSSYDIILSYLVKNSIQRNMNRRGEKRVGAGREESPLFAKITKKWINNIGIIYLENRWKRLHMFWKSSFLRQWFMQTPCHFSPPLMIELRSIRLCQWLSLVRINKIIT